jgi:uncharacterized SAM-binding protein YcdF (DUF218 family)
MVVAAGLAAVERKLYLNVREHATRDETRPADAIVVFGAAQYVGRPSPVFKARLDHAAALEDRGFAPLILTTGGSGGDPDYTEAGVGRDYLIQRGVAEAKIISETESETTFQSVQAVARILRGRGARSCLAVSDGFHLYRIKLMFAGTGITVYGSPVPDSPIEADSIQRRLHSLREALVSTLWFLGIRR